MLGRAARYEKVQWKFLANEPGGGWGRKGGWAIAQRPILSTTLTLKRLKQRGYQSLTAVYIELNPSLCEPPST
ncbi:hypothetical protein [Flavobacterium macacae]|uniref:hypothetical protein n=1 Tax=Flavobacterium macacae TaxID=2488993 RepID=UPI0037436841